MAEDSLKVSIKGDLEDLQAKVQQGDRELAAFKLKAEANAQIKLKVDLAKYQSDLADARKQLTAFRKAGDAEGEIKTRLNIEELQKKIRDGRSALKDLQGELGATERSFFSLNGIVTDAIKAFTGLQVIRSITGLLQDAFNASVSFESAFAGVRKTVEGTPEELAQLSDEFRQLAKNIPLPVEGLARIGELAGQLGIAKEDIIAFTQTIAKLGVTTNLTEEQAATSLARIATIFKQPAADVERFGSSIVALGNNFATTEQEIVNFATNIAGTAAAVGLSTQDIAALGAAFSSVGVEAEAGGTAVQKTLLTLNQAVVNGGEELDRFAEIAGTSAQDFANIWKSAPIKAFDLFVKGLGNSGDQAANVLDELVAGDVRLSRAFLSLAQSGDLLTRTIDVSNTAFEQNNALTKEADTRFGTAESKLQLLRTRWNDLAITIGDFLVKVAVPVLTFLTELAETLVNGAGKFATLASAIKATGVGLATYFSVSILSGIAKAVGVLATSMSLLATRAGVVGVSLSSLGSVGALASRGLASVAGAAGLVTAALGPVSLGIAAVSFAFIAAKQRSEALKAALEALGASLDELAGSNFEAQRLADEIDNLTKKAVEAQNAMNGLALSANTQSEFEELSAAAEQQKVAVEELRQSYVDYLTALGATPEQIEAVKSELTFFSDTARVTNKDIRELGDATSEVGKIFADIGQNFGDLSERFRKSVDASVSAGIDLEDAVKDAKGSIVDDFGDIAGSVEDFTGEMVKSLVRTAAESGDLGKAFTVGYAGGVSGPDVLAIIDQAGIQITRPLQAQLLANAIEAKDTGTVLGILHAEGISDTELENIRVADDLSGAVISAIEAKEANARAAGQNLGSASVGGITEGIRKQFPGLSSAFSGILKLLQTAGGVGDIKLTGIEAIDSRISSIVSFGSELITKANSLSEALKVAQKEVNSPSISSGGGGGGGGGGAFKEAEKKAKEAEKAVEDFNKQIEETGRQSALLKGKVKEFYGEIVDEIDKAREAQDLLNAEFAEFKEKETQGFVKDTARRDVDLANEQKDVEKELAELGAKQADDAEGAAQIAADRIELEEELNKILEERKKIQAFLNENPDQRGTFEAEKDLAGRSQFEQDKAAFDARIAQAEDDLRTELEKQQKIIDIRERFLAIQAGQDAESIAARERLNAIASGKENLNAEQRKQALQELGFEELTVQEQIDLLKQAQQAEALEAEKEIILQKEQEILDAKTEFFRLAQDAHATTVDAMIVKTQQLIDLLKTAQIEAAKLSALERSAESSSAKSGDTTVNMYNNVASGIDAEAMGNQFLNKVNL